MEPLSADSICSLFNTGVAHSTKASAEMALKADKICAEQLTDGAVAPRREYPGHPCAEYDVIAAPKSAASGGSRDLPADLAATPPIF